MKEGNGSVKATAAKGKNKPGLSKNKFKKKRKRIAATMKKNSEKVVS